MKIEFNNHENDLEVIERFLDRHQNPTTSELDAFIEKLTKIDVSLNQQLQDPNSEPTRYIRKQSEMAKKLMGKCFELKIQREIIDLAEACELCSNNSPEKTADEVMKEVFFLREKLDDFAKNHRPSRNNTKFIRFARACLDKAEKHEPVLISKKGTKPQKSISIDSFRLKEPNLESFEISELLYELAGLLYREKFDEFEIFLAETFSKECQNEIRFHVNQCGGDLKNTNDKTIRLKTVQGILGMAHELVDYYLGDTPYPSIVEIHNLFQDLEFIEDSEKHEPS